jgi:hypothetical protein
MGEADPRNRQQRRHRTGYRLDDLGLQDRPDPLSEPKDTNAKTVPARTVPYSNVAIQIASRKPMTVKSPAALPPSSWDSGIIESVNIVNIAPAANI